MLKKAGVPMLRTEDVAAAILYSALQSSKDIDKGRTAGKAVMLDQECVCFSYSEQSPPDPLHFVLERGATAVALNPMLAVAREAQEKPKKGEERL
jgi:hypothetical protein